MNYRLVHEVSQRAICGSGAASCRALTQQTTAVVLTKHV